MLPIIAPMSDLPLSIHSIAQIKAIENAAIDSGLDAYLLMNRAGQAAYAALRAEWPDVVHILVVCGFGNNAGDGFVLARLAAAQGMQVTCVVLCQPEQLHGAARQACQVYINEGGKLQPWNVELLQSAELIVDAIFGTGLSRTLDESLQSVINTLNQSVLPKFSLDIPSGLQADSGHVMGAAIYAQCTLCFVGLKQGFYLAEGPNHVGKILFDDLSIPASLCECVETIAKRLDHLFVRQALPSRTRTAHKGQGGHVLIVGGGRGMAGAVRLTGEACLRSGAGLVTVVTHPEHVMNVVLERPELMVKGVRHAEELVTLLERADVIAIGPGLGQDEWAHELFAAVIATNKPLIVDADALNLLAVEPCYRTNWVLTPHPGEAARLLKMTTGSIQSARLESAQSLVLRYGGIAVLKGSGTWVACASELPVVCDRGNPAMAAPGMGDLLTGVIAGIAAQQADVNSGLWRSACAGVYVHAWAGDKAAQGRSRGLIASDLLKYLPDCVNP